MDVWNAVVAGAFALAGTALGGWWSHRKLRDAAREGRRQGLAESSHRLHERMSEGAASVNVAYLRLLQNLAAFPDSSDSEKRASAANELAAARELAREVMITLALCSDAELRTLAVAVAKDAIHGLSELVKLGAFEGDAKHIRETVERLAKSHGDGLNDVVQAQIQLNQRRDQLVLADP